MEISEFPSFEDVAEFCLLDVSSSKDQRCKGNEKAPAGTVQQQAGIRQIVAVHVYVRVRQLHK